MVDVLDILLYFKNVSFNYEFLYTSVYSIQNRFIFYIFLVVDLPVLVPSK